MGISKEGAVDCGFLCHSDFNLKTLCWRGDHCSSPLMGFKAGRTHGRSVFTPEYYRLGPGGPEKEEMIVQPA